MATKYKQRKDGRYGTKVYTGKINQNGTYEYIDVYESTSAKLEKEVSRIKNEIDKGIYANDKGLTFRKYAEKWLELFKDTTGIANYQKYAGIVKNHIAPIENMKLREIKKSDVQITINSQKDHPDTKRMLKIVINKVLESAIEDGLIYRNVARSIKVAQPVQQQLSTRILTEKEKEAIKWCKENKFNSMQKLFVDTLFVSGIRPSECLALTRADISISGKSISINKSLSYKGGKYIKEPKSQSGYRKIDVPSWYIEEYEAYLKESNDLYIFPGLRGGIIPQSTYKRFWKTIFDEINLRMGGSENLKVTDLTPYIFRHNYCTMLYYLKIDLKRAQYLMGHADIKLTLGVYTHLASLEKEDEEKVESIAL